MDGSAEEKAVLGEWRTGTGEPASCPFLLCPSVLFPIRSACKLVRGSQAHTWKYKYVISAKILELLAKRTANVCRYSCFKRRGQNESWQTAGLVVSTS